MEITDIQIWQPKAPNGERHSEFSANIAIDDTWMIQLGTTGEFSIPGGHLAAWKDEDAQDQACDTYDPDEIAQELRIPTTVEGLRALGGAHMID